MQRALQTDWFGPLAITLIAIAFILSLIHI